jgi:hypothetical protein
MEIVYNTVFVHVYSTGTGPCRTSARRGSAELGAIASNGGKDQAPNQQQINDPLQFMIFDS